MELQTENTVLQRYTTIYKNNRYDFLDSKKSELFGLAIEGDEHQMSNETYRNYGSYKHSLYCDSSLVKINETYYNDKYILDNFFGSKPDFIFSGIIINPWFSTNGNEASLEDIFCEYGYEYLKEWDTNHIYFDNSEENKGMWRILKTGEVYRVKIKDENDNDLWVNKSVVYDGTYVPTVQELLDGNLYIVIQSGSLEPKELYINNENIPSLFVNDDKYPNTTNKNDKTIYDFVLHLGGDEYILHDQQTMKLCDITLYQRFPCLVQLGNIFGIKNEILFLYQVYKTLGLVTNKETDIDDLYKSNIMKLQVQAYANYSFVTVDKNDEENILIANENILSHSLDKTKAALNYKSTSSWYDLLMNDIKTAPVYIGTVNNGYIHMDIYYALTLTFQNVAYGKVHLEYFIDEFEDTSEYYKSENINKSVPLFLNEDSTNEDEDIPIYVHYYLTDASGKEIAVNTIGNFSIKDDKFYLLGEPYDIPGMLVYNGEGNPKFNSKTIDTSLGSRTVRTYYLSPNADDKNTYMYQRSFDLVLNYGNDNDELIVPVNQYGTSKPLPNFLFFAFKYKYSSSDGTDLDTATFVSCSGNGELPEYVLNKTTKKYEFTGRVYSRAKNGDESTYSTGVSISDTQKLRHFVGFSGSIWFEYMKHYGDNTNAGGVESVTVNLQSLLDSYRISESDDATNGRKKITEFTGGSGTILGEIYIDILGTWYSSRDHGEVDLTFELYKHTNQEKQDGSFTENNYEYSPQNLTLVFSQEQTVNVGSETHAEPPTTYTHFAHLVYDIKSTESFLYMRKRENKYGSPNTEENLNKYRGVWTHTTIIEDMETYLERSLWYILQKNNSVEDD